MCTESKDHYLGETQPIPDRAGKKPGEDSLRLMGFRSAWESSVLRVLSWIFIWPVRSEVSFAGLEGRERGRPCSKTPSIKQRG